MLAAGMQQVVKADCLTCMAAPIITGNCEHWTPKAVDSRYFLAAQSGSIY